MQTKLLSIIPEYLSLGLIVYDKDGCLKYANSIALDMFGVILNDIIDVNLFDDPNIIDADKAQLKKGLNVCFETNYDFDRCREYFVKTASIEAKKYFITKVTIMRDSDGNHQGFLLTCEDITEKKAQEQEVVNSYQKIKSTQRELSLALNAGDLTSWNYMVEDGMFYEFSDQIEHQGKRSLEAICKHLHPDDTERFLAILDNAIHNRELLDDKIVLRALDDSNHTYRHYNLVYSVTDDGNGKVTGITFIQRDITEDIKYQQNLINAKDKAEQADKLKSTFLATMSHEIRTPLNAIVGFSQLLSETTDTEEKNEYKQVIETNSEILLKLIGDILDLSKIEAGFIDVNRQMLDVTQICQDLYHSFKQHINTPDVTLRLVDPYDKCMANLDKHRFIQIFTNFLTNAIKYTPKGEIVMGYECLPGQIRVYVKDSGIGISDSKKDRIFSRFEKLDDFAQGTGLGLSICKAIADATGGQIGFESKVNEGSEFWYIGHTDIEYVEKMQLPQTKSGQEPAAGAGQHIGSTLNRNLNILVAEDNDSNFLLISHILKNNRLTRAITGLEAVEKIKGQIFDAVLMDIKMPVMNGLEATTLIREFDHHTPIIALTANAFNADKDAALAVGCNYFITKPIKKQELLETLSKL